jgi:hypothetical protein
MWRRGRVLNEILFNHDSGDYDEGGHKVLSTLHIDRIRAAMSLSSNVLGIRAGRD